MESLPRGFMLLAHLADLEQTVLGAVDSRSRVHGESTENSRLLREVGAEKSTAAQCTFPVFV